MQVVRRNAGPRVSGRVFAMNCVECWSLAGPFAAGGLDGGVRRRRGRGDAAVARQGVVLQPDGRVLAAGVAAINGVARITEGVEKLIRVIGF